MPRNWMNFMAYGRLSDSSGPWMLESVPQAPVIRNWANGKVFFRIPMKGIEPPVPT